MHDPNRRDLQLKIAASPAGSKFHCIILKAMLLIWIGESFKICRFQDFLGVGKEKLVIYTYFTLSIPYIHLIILAFGF
jgi:hypothetical protein